MPGSVAPTGSTRTLAQAYRRFGESDAAGLYARVAVALRDVRRVYGRGRWRKRKGIARVRLSDGTIRIAELHWYEATGIGRREYKIKRLI